MPQSRKSPVQTNAAFAPLVISWGLKDGLIIPDALREKLDVPDDQLLAALAALTPPERHELKCGILQSSAAGSLPGPLRARELCAFVEELTPGTPG